MVMCSWERPVVGDEVKDRHGNKYVVVNIADTDDGKFYDLLSPLFGMTTNWNPIKLVMTGRHFPEIPEVLAKLR